jgi:hypothetical protein
VTLTARTTDLEIRGALHSRCLRRARRDPNTLVVEELGLAHSKRRIDVAVINGSIHGYEIKSDRDNLKRFPEQLHIYRTSLQKLTIVTSSKHVSGLMQILPSWCGVKVATRARRGGVVFEDLQRPASNPDADRVMVAHLLWRDEVVRLLTSLGCKPSELRMPRKELYRLLADKMEMNEITTSIRTAMAGRQGWRCPPVRT